jgi:hypothetical protein
MENFDAVQHMRELRDCISREIEGMTFEEQKAYFRERLTQAREADRDPFPEHVSAQ